MTAYYKATRPDGRDFYSGTIDYAAALASGEVIRHPSKRKVRNDAGTYLSVSTEPADCTGFRWPCRLFRVEPVGRVGTSGDYPHKRTTRALRVVEELPAWQALGPNGERVAAFIDALGTLTADDWRRVAAAWEATWAAVRAAAGAAAWVAARVAARAAARAAAWEAAVAMVARDLITPAQYALLVRPFVDAGLGEVVA